LSDLQERIWHARTVNGSSWHVIRQRPWSISFKFCFCLVSISTGLDDLGRDGEVSEGGFSYDSCIVTLEDARADVVQRNMSVTASSADTEFEFWVSRLESRAGGRLGAQG